MAQSELEPVALRQLPIHQWPPDLYLFFIPFLLALESIIISVMMLDRKVLNGFSNSEKSPIVRYFAKHYSRQAEGKEKSHWGTVNICLTVETISGSCYTGLLYIAPEADIMFWNIYMFPRGYSFSCSLIETLIYPWNDSQYNDYSKIKHILYTIYNISIYNI